MLTGLGRMVVRDQGDGSPPTRAIAGSKPLLDRLPIHLWSHCTDTYLRKWVTNGYSKWNGQPGVLLHTCLVLCPAFLGYSPSQIYHTENPEASYCSIILPDIPPQPNQPTVSYSHQTVMTTT